MTLFCIPWLNHHWMKQLGLLRLSQQTLATDFKCQFFCTVPVFKHPISKALDTIRRDNFMGNQWVVWSMTEILFEKPDEGPTRVFRARRITMIRACLWVGLCNVPIMLTDVSVVRRIKKMVTACGTGLPTI